LPRGRSIVLLRSAGLLASCIAAFLVTAAAIRGLLPWPAEGSLDARWRHFQANVGAYDVVFVGSSNIARAIDPAVFDAELARLGHPVRSYNLAADNMQPTEADFVLREVMGQSASRVRWAVIELLEFAPRGMIATNPFTDRAIYWHDGLGLLGALRRVAASVEPIGAKLQLGWLHVRHAAWRASNFGRAEGSIAALRRGPDPLDETVAAAGGFEALDDRPDPSAERVRRRFLASVPVYLAGLPQVDVRNRVPAIAPADEVARVRAQAAWLRASGIEPLYVIPPLPGASPELYAIAREPGMPAVTALNSPARFPDLYEPAHRYDATHVNRAGAARASVRLAEELAPLLDRH
jgi:hypothetical protein